MPRVLVTAPGVTGPNDPRLQPLVDAGWQIRTHRWPGGRPAEEDVVELVQGNDAVIASASERYTPGVISRADTLKHIARWGVGYETVDVPEVVVVAREDREIGIEDPVEGQRLLGQPLVLP